MNKFYAIIFTLLGSSNLFAQSFCDQQANVILFSNFDGGTLNINIDQNIPNIKIGIVSYEAAAINISGTYAGNVSEVRYVGYNATNNTNCSPPVPSTSITGVPNSVDTIITVPASTYNNPNGYSYILCNYSCDNQTNQGGCNTPDQIVHYFITNFGGSLYFHQTQYFCWTANTTYSISTGGNCCINPFVTSVYESEPVSQLTIIPIPAQGSITIVAPGGNNANIEIMNLLGEVLLKNVTPGTVDISALPQGIYIARGIAEGKLLVNTFVVEK